MAQREIAQAQDAFLKGEMRGCAVHLSRAANASTVAQVPSAGPMAQGMALGPAPYLAAPQGPYQGPYEAPAEAQYATQPQWGWQQPAPSGY
jgi:hypothetical protein